MRHGTRCVPSVAFADVNLDRVVRLVCRHEYRRSRRRPVGACGGTSARRSRRARRGGAAARAESASSATNRSLAYVAHGVRGAAVRTLPHRPIAAAGCGRRGRPRCRSVHQREPRLSGLALRVQRRDFARRHCRATCSRTPVFGSALGRASSSPWPNWHPHSRRIAVSISDWMPSAITESPSVVPT